MSNARTFVNPNTAKSIVIMDNTTFEIFKASPLQIPICHSVLIILPQFRERGNSLFLKPISHLSDIRNGRSFRCRLRVVHRWTAP